MNKTWIYNLDDYQSIFGLTAQELQKRILDFPSGISSVNAELYAKGFYMVSADPAYQLTPEEMRIHAYEMLQTSIQQLEPDNNHFSLISKWRMSTEIFLSDYALGKKEGRYKVLNHPPFQPLENSFELLLCTDYLFTANSSSLPIQQMMEELCNLAMEVRIFPLPNLQSAVASELGPVMLALQNRNFGVEVRGVAYPERKEANAILRVWAKECTISN
ncbi:MAG: hypothetical protein JSR33_05760 [Proteobacteria bacterium]|nr:hypothetical protein [Pseudomonadota bacterium]